MFAQDTIQSKHLQEVSVLESVSRANISSLSVVQTFTAKEISDLGLTEIAEALRQVNGVTIKDYGGLGGMKTVSVRNLGAEHTGVIYDGVPVSNCQAGQIDLSRFSTENVQSLKMGIGAPAEMLMPASIEPFSGTLIIKTHGDSTPWTKLSYGSFNTFNASANATHSIANTAELDARLQYTHTDGDYPFTLTNGNLKTKETRRNGEVNKVNGEVNFTTQTSHSSKLEVKAYYYYSDRGLPGGIIYYNDLANERLWDENFFSQAKYMAKIGSQWDVQAIVKYNHSWNKYFDGIEAVNSGIIMHTYTYRQDETFVSAGIMHRVKATDDKLQFAFINDGIWNGFSTNIPEIEKKRRTTNYSTFRAKYETEHFTASASLLWTSLNEKNNKSESRITPSASANIKPFSNRNLFARVSFRQAFRLPTFNDMYYYRLGNHNLKPEKTNEFNIGTTYSSPHKTFFITADIYHIKVNDKIVAFPTTFAWKMSNYGKVDIKGANISTELHIHNIQINIGYNYSDMRNATDTKQPDYRKPLPYTANHSGNGSLIWKNKFANIGYSVIWTGERHSSTMQEARYRLAPYHDHSIALSRSFQLGRGSLDINISCKNIFNQQYEIVQFYPMPGRQFMVSLRKTFALLPKNLDD